MLLAIVCANFEETSATYVTTVQRAPQAILSPCGTDAEKFTKNVDN